MLGLRALHSYFHLSCPWSEFAKRYLAEVNNTQAITFWTAMQRIYQDWCEQYQIEDPSTARMLAFINIDEFNVLVNTELQLNTTIAQLYSELHGKDG